MLTNKQAERLAHHSRRPRRVRGDLEPCTNRSCAQASTTSSDVMEQQPACSRHMARLENRLPTVFAEQLNLDHQNGDWDGRRHQFSQSRSHP
jgi:hypothetical protein